MTRYRKAWVLRAFGLVLTVATAWSSVGVASAAPVTTLKVMSRNLYLGADLGPIIAAPDFATLIQRTADAWQTVQNNDFRERAEALADEIATASPHVVGLQEVEIWRTAPADFSTTPNADHVEYDFLAILLDELAERGRSYEAVASIENYDVEAPMWTAGGLVDLRLTDRDVTIVRSDVPPTVFDVTGSSEGNFAAFLPVPTLSGVVAIHRGWTSVDVSVAGRAVRVVNTHLEPLHALVQLAQAAELLSGPTNVGGRVVLLGDLNSRGDGTRTASYGLITGAGGFADTWVLRHGDAPGLTCCFAEDLSDASASLYERVDFVLVRGALDVARIKRIGEQPEDRTPSGLWPSDHAGLRAVLRVA